MPTKEQNTEIENAVLYSIFKYPYKQKDIFRELESGDFANFHNRIVFNFVKDIYQKEGNVPTVSTIFSLMKNSGNVTKENLVGAKSAMETFRKVCIPDSDLKKCIQELKRLAAIRTVIKKSGELVDKLSTDNIDVELSTYNRDVEKVRQRLTESFAESMMTLKGDITQRIDHTKQVTNNPTTLGMVCYGFKNFDKWLNPITPGSLVIYQARTNSGKSMFLMGSALSNYARGRNVVYITIEMSPIEVLFRMDSHITDLKHELFAKGEIAKDVDLTDLWKKKVEQYGGAKQTNDLYVYGVLENCTPQKIDDILASLTFHPDLVVIDYAGDMKANLKGIANYDPKAHAEIYSRLKEIAGKYHTVVWTAQQTKRGANKGQVLTTEDGAWTDVASGKADVMIAIQETKEDKLYESEHDGVKVTGRYTIAIIKNRNGEKLKTNIVPHFYKMKWIEKECEAKMYIGIDYEDAGKSNDTEKETKLDDLEKRLQASTGRKKTSNAPKVVVQDDQEPDNQELDNNVLDSL